MLQGNSHRANFETLLLNACGSSLQWETHCWFSSIRDNCTNSQLALKLRKHRQCSFPPLPATPLTARLQEGEKPALWPHAQG